MNTGEKIKKLRKEKGLSRPKLGEKSGLSTMTIQRCELHNANLRIENIRKIADALGVPALDLLDDDILVTLKQTDMEKIVWQTSVMLRAIETFGPQRQVDKLMEEMDELGQAALKLRYDQTKEIYEHFVEECADVEIMLEQMKLIHNNHGYVEARKTEKLARLERTMEELQEEWM